MPIVGQPFFQGMMMMMMTEPSPETRLISGSEVSTFQSCQMRWWFQFRLGVQPIKLSDALFVGTMGHEALSTYYSQIKEGVYWREAIESMTDFVVREMDKNNKLRRTGFITSQMASERQVLINKTAMILEEYANHYAESDSLRYQVVEVEHMHVSGHFFAMRLDLLLRDNDTGQLVLMDHKFIRDFYLEKQLMMNSQLPRYMRVVIGDRMETVSHGLLNQLRTRDVKDNDKRFQRARLPYDEVVADKRASDQEKVAQQIRLKYDLSKRESMDTVIRTFSDYTCKFCPFTDPCALALAGKVDEMKEVLNRDYEKSTYGYNKS